MSWDLLPRRVRNISAKHGNNKLKSRLSWENKASYTAFTWTCTDIDSNFKKNEFTCLIWRSPIAVTSTPFLSGNLALSKRNLFDFDCTRVSCKVHIISWIALSERSSITQTATARLVELGLRYSSLTSTEISISKLSPSSSAGIWWHEISLKNLFLINNRNKIKNRKLNWSHYFKIFKCLLYTWSHFKAVTHAAIIRRFYNLHRVL